MVNNMTTQSEKEPTQEAMPFWGLRTTSSKGMRFNTRQVWHYFTWQKTWARGEGFFTICRGNFPDHETFTHAKRTDKPLGKESCSDCYRIYNQKVREAKS